MSEGVDLDAFEAHIYAAFDLLVEFIPTAMRVHGHNTEYPARIFLGQRGDVVMNRRGIFGAGEWENQRAVNAILSKAPNSPSSETE